MSAHIDTLDERQPLGRYFAGSLVLHVSLVAAALTYTWAGLVSRGPLLGDPHGGGAGSVLVKTVPSINLPAKTAITNPVANDTQSLAPTPPPVKTKPQPKAKPKELENAIPIKDKSAKTKTYRDHYEAPLNNWRAQQHDAHNQLYSTTGQALASPMIGKAGSDGVRLGNDSPFGQQYGWYAKLVRDEVARHWNTGDVNARLQSAPPVVVTFTILRDGKVAPGSVKVAQTSGVAPLDFSAQRAVLDATFSGLPPGFPKSQVDVELRFELRR